MITAPLHIRTLCVKIIFLLSLFHTNVIIIIISRVTGDIILLRVPEAALHYHYYHITTIPVLCY